MIQAEEYDYLHFREFSYDLFRRLFMEEPSVELLRFLQQQDLATLFPYLHNEADFTPAVNALNEYLSENEFSAGEEPFENVHWDYTRLFIGPETPPAPPWESVYVSRDKLLFQQCTNEVKRIYQQNGFALGEDEVEPADHIGFELDFLYRQSGLVVEQLDESDSDESIKALLQQQLEFLTHHLLAFSGRFCQNVQQHAETAFYRNFSVIMQLFLTLDKQRLERLVNE